VKRSLDLSVLIPAYLEEENLRILLPRLKSTLQASGLSFEVLVIDTETPMDGTKEVCESVEVGYVSRLGGNFYGDAVRTGLGRALGRALVFMDADGSHSPEFCLELIQHQGEGDVVIASRYVEGGSTDNSKALIFMSRVVNVLYSVILGLNCRDVSNSFKLYKAELFDGVTLVCKNFDIVEEMLFKIKQRKKDVRFVEIPFSFKERMFGHTKRDLFAFILTYFVTILKLRFGSHR